MWAALAAPSVALLSKTAAFNPNPAPLGYFQLHLPLSLPTAPCPESLEQGFIGHISAVCSPARLPRVSNSPAAEGVTRHRDKPVRLDNHRSSSSSSHR